MAPARARRDDTASAETSGIDPDDWDLAGGQDDEPLQPMRLGMGMGGGRGGPRSLRRLSHIDSGASRASRGFALGFSQEASIDPGELDTHSYGGVESVPESPAGGAEGDAHAATEGGVPATGKPGGLLYLKV